MKRIFKGNRKEELNSVDIIIVTWNALAYLKKCINAVRRFTRNWDYAIYVVDNGSSDGTRKYLKSQKDINRIFNSRNLGFPKAANIALKKINSEFIVCLDDDVEVTENWLDGLYKEIRKDKKIGIVGPKILKPNGTIEEARLPVSSTLTYSDGEIDKGQRDYVKEVDVVFGSCWLMRWEIIKKIGYFDERFSPVQCEDDDYCWRARKVGYKIVYNGKVKIYHYSLNRNVRKYYNKNKTKLYKKWNIKPPFLFKDTHPADKHNSKAIEYLIKKKYKVALIEFKKAESIDKRFGVPFYKGLALEGMKKYKKAIKEFKRELKYKPKNLEIELHHAIARCHSRMGMRKHALDHCIKAMEILPQND